MAFQWEDAVVSVVFLWGWYYFWSTIIDLSWRLFGPTFIIIQMELEEHSK